MPVVPITSPISLDAPIWEICLYVALLVVGAAAIWYLGSKSATAINEEKTVYDSKDIAAAEATTDKSDQDLNAQTAKFPKN